MKHWRYLNYVVRHKWYVMKACFKRGMYWRGIKHDLSKLLPSEWFPYVEYFYGPRYSEAEFDRAKRIGIFLPTRQEVTDKFNVAWLKHQHRNDHHWQHWVLTGDGGDVIAMEMPVKCRLEMLSDWDGAGMAINGRIDTKNWYLRNRDIIKLHPITRSMVELDLGISCFEGAETCAACS